MARIIIRRLVGVLFLVVGMSVLGAEIGVRGTTGVLLIFLGFIIAAGSKEFLGSLSKELKAKQEKKITAS